MSSVFMTPGTNPTSIPLRDQATPGPRRSASSRASAGRSACAAAGWWRVIAWSVRRRRRSALPVAAAYWNEPTRRWLERDPRQHRPGLRFFVAGHALAGGDDGERPRRRDAECVHGLADHVLAQHRRERRPAVPAAGERRAARALEVQVAPTSRGVGELAEQQRRPARPAAPKALVAANAPPGVAPAGTAAPASTATPSGLRSASASSPSSPASSSLSDQLGRRRGRAACHAW